MPFGKADNTVLISHHKNSYFGVPDVGNSLFGYACLQLVTDGRGWKLRKKALLPNAALWMAAIASASDSVAMNKLSVPSGRCRLLALCCFVLDILR